VLIAGRYKLLEEIGAGGMGTVWVAEQTSPVKRKVALKLIKPGMDSKSVLARFEQERQALALMDHPSIAKVLDGGLTDDRRPFFVMEYVKGVPITEYCDAAQLTIQERLNLFVQVCQAVQHAHQKGIIHRDLKPSNILVAPYDDKPVPKVIDFGLAKAMHQSLTERTLHTAHESVIGTPLYMSPEQAQLNNLDIDTRSDIYSLGVLLYELLTGTTPLERKRFKEAAWDEVRRIIREEEPPRPSTRLSSANKLPSLAACRHTEPASLTKQVRGELDWIVMKALEKDRNRRYETANGFAMDLQRYLAGEPVLAVPPSTGYRLRKFVRKNRGKIAVAALLLATLTAGVVGTTIGLFRALAAERLATERLAQVSAERDRAESAEKQIAAVNRFLVDDLLAEAAPDRQPVGKQFTVREALDKAAEKLDAAFADQPEIEAQIRRTMGWTYSTLGLPTKAEMHWRRGYELLRQKHGAEAQQTLAVLNRLIYALGAQGGERRVEAERLCRACLETCRRVLGPEHEETLLAITNTADLQSYRGEHAEAEALYRQVVEARSRLTGAEHRDTLAVLNSLAVEQYWQAKYAEAEATHRRILEVHLRRHGLDHPHTLTAQHNVVLALDAQGKLAEAEQLARLTLDARRRVMGPEHSHTLSSLNTVASVCHQQGKATEAEALYRELLQTCSRVLGPTHDLTLTALNNLALILSAQGRFEEAEPLFRQALEARTRASGPEHPLTLSSLQGLANLLQKQNRLTEAEQLFRQVLETHRRVSGADHPSTLLALNSLAGLLVDRGEFAEAEPLCRAALEGRRQKLPASHRNIATSLSTLSRLLLAKGHPKEAEPLLREALSIYQKSPRDKDWELGNAQSLLGGCLADQARHPEAEPLLRAGYEVMRQSPGAPSLRTRQGAERLLRLYETIGKKNEAAKWQKELESIGKPAKPSADR
jgi:tetratricopeptide (TPR) repeat protein/tRNA A-37 threonylcarbamoyl transferase component Bud32